MERRVRPSAFLLPALLTTLLAASCDKVTPVAPGGAVLTVSANPTFIETDGQSVITIIARAEDGSPVNPGTEVLVSTTLGTIDEVVTTDERGVATSILRGDGRAGLADVVVSSGAAAPVTLNPPIQIGSFAAFISLQATPTTVNEGGGDITLLALIRGDTGTPLANAVVNFVTPFGTLASQGGPIITDADGQAIDTLTLTESDVASITGTSFVVNAETAGSESALIQGSFTITVARLRPQASFTVSDGGGNTAIFNSTSTGGQPLTHQWDFTNDGIIDSTGASTSFTYSAAGTYTARLKVVNDQGESEALQSVTVPLG